MAQLVPYLAENRGLLARVFSVRPLVWLGKRSYALYLWHYVWATWTNPLPFWPGLAAGLARHAGVHPGSPGTWSRSPRSASASAGRCVRPPGRGRSRRWPPSAGLRQDQLLAGLDAGAVEVVELADLLHERARVVAGGHPAGDRPERLALVDGGLGVGGERRIVWPGVRPAASEWAERPRLKATRSRHRSVSRTTTRPRRVSRTGPAATAAAGRGMWWVIGVGCVVCVVMVLSY